jgi:hypothetical protein
MEFQSYGGVLLFKNNTGVVSLKRGVRATAVVNRIGVSPGIVPRHPILFHIFEALHCYFMCICLCTRKNEDKVMLLTSHNY